MISLTDFDAASRRHNDVILLTAICRVSGNDFVLAGQCTGTAELLHQEMWNFLAPNLWPPNSRDLSPVGYEIWAVKQHRVCHRKVHSVDELKRRLSDVWWGLEQSIFDEAILTSDEEVIERVSTLKENISRTACELADNIDFVHICCIQCDLF